MEVSRIEQNKRANQRVLIGPFGAPSLLGRFVAAALWIFRRPIAVATLFGFVGTRALRRALLLVVAAWLATGFGALWRALLLLRIATFGLLVVAIALR